MGCASSKPDETQSVALQRDTRLANNNDSTLPVENIVSPSVKSRRGPQGISQPQVPQYNASITTAVENTVGLSAKSRKSLPEPSGPRPNPSGTNKPPTDEMGLHILYEDDNADIDIVAVHGLAANSRYTWCWNPKDNPPGKEGYPQESFNWLENLLPFSLRDSANISCRVMVFNHDSYWIAKAPEQRLSNISGRLLDCIANKRKDAMTRPLIFIGHSFGGNLIEHAINSASRPAASQEGFNYDKIAASTAGVIFLGTPHRGCDAARWSEVITSLSGIFCESNDKIVKAIVQDSDLLLDSLQHFCRWLFLESVPVACFFENLQTDVAKRRGPVSKIPIGTKRLLVPEGSACILGHHQTQLHSDHSKMNKYYGKKDPSYELVFCQVERMAKEAQGLLSRRQYPHAISRIEDLKNDNLKECLQELRVTDPRDILEDIRGEKEKRSGQTCNWILTEEKFSHWANTKTSQLLRIFGPPGIGKTMMATFLVEKIETRIRKSSKGAFAYFFCDDKKTEDRRMPTAILRSLIWQLLLQNKYLFKHLEKDFNGCVNGRVFEDLFQNFSALWRIFKAMLRDQEAGEVFILIDAFDECDRASRERLLTGVDELFSTQSEQSPGRVKFLVTHRSQIPDVEMALRPLGDYLEIDSTKIKQDLQEYIEMKIQSLVRSKPAFEHAEGMIRRALAAGTEGTFLWVSLMAAEIGRPGVRTEHVNEILSNPPPKLEGIYAYIFNQIPDFDQITAGFILHYMVAAKRPLTKIEIVIAYATFRLPSENTRKNEVPRQQSVNKYDDILSACSSILIPTPTDSNNPTISFCHQSVKDFLLKDSSRTNHEWYQTTIDKANLLVFQTFWKYLTAQDCLLAQSLMGKPRQPARKWEPKGKGAPYPGPHRFLKWGKRATAKYPEYMLLRYVHDTWEKHAASCYPAVKEGLGIDLDEAPALRDIWFLCAARSGQVEVLKLLLRADHAMLSVVDQFSATPLSLAAENGHVGVIKLLLATGKAEIHSVNLRGQTPLSQAAFNGHVGVVKLLLATGQAKTEHSMLDGSTPLHRAAEEGHLDVVKELLASGADINSKTSSGGTAIILARRKAVVDELLARGAQMDLMEGNGNPEVESEDDVDWDKTLRDMGYEFRYQYS